MNDMTGKKITRAGQKGFILLTSYLLISMISIFSLGLFARSAAFIQSVERNKNKIIAFQKAEAGLDQAIVELTDDQNYSGMAYIPLGDEGGYSVTVCPPTCGGDLTEPTDANVRMIQTTGFAPDNDPTSTAYSSRSVISHVNIAGSSGFDFAVFAGDSVTLNGTTSIDSYNSNDGPYGANTASANGDVGTDSVTTSTVSLNGSSTINGDVTVGPSGNPTDVISASSQSLITGSQTSASTEKNYQVMTSSSTSLGSLSVSGSTKLTLAAGTYRYSSLKITGNAKITTTGAVKIYVDGTVNIGGGGIVNATATPSNLLVYATTSASVSVSGNSDFYGAVYAPASAVSVSGASDFYGAVVADSFTQSGEFHYDEALNDLEGATDSNSTPNLLAWRETNTSAA